MKMRKLKPKRLNRSLGGDVANIVILVIFGSFMVLPMIYAISNAFKPLDEIFMFPPRFFVRNPTTDNFRDLFLLMAQSWVPFSRYIFNTLFTTAAGTAGHVVIASMAAFALEKHKFPIEALFQHSSHLTHVLACRNSDTELSGDGQAQLARYISCTDRTCIWIFSWFVPHEAVHGHHS